MSIARDRANRSGTDPLQIDNTKLITDSGDLKVQDTSGNEKKLIADEIHVGTGSDKVILKRDSSTGKVAIQTQASGEAAQGGTVASTTIYATTALLPTSPSDGEQALVTANNFLYIAKSSGWYKIAEITNTTPSITSAGNATYQFLTDGTPVSIEITATDAEVGTALQYKYVVSSGSIGSTATVTSSATSGGTYSALAANTLTTNKFFKVTPSTNSAHAGTFSLTFSASDGVAVGTSSASEFTLQFDVSGSFKFDGSGDYVTTTDNSSYAFGTGAFSVECFYNVDFDTSGSDTIFLYDFGSEDVRVTFKSGAIRAQLGSETQLSYSISGNTLDKNTFHHHALTRDGSGNVRLYHNGSEVGSYSSSSYNVASTTLRIGDKHSGSKEFTGYISNFRIVKGSLAYTTITTGAGLDFGSSNSTLTTTASHSGFDFGSNNFTIEFFYKWSTNSGYQTILDHNYNDAAGVAIQSNTNTYKWGVFGSGLSLVYESSDATTGVWHHYAVVRNGNTVKMYRDGVQTLSQSKTGTVGGVYATTFGGVTSQNDHYDKGKISNFRVVKGTALYTGTFTPPTAPLTAISGTSLLLFQESSGSTLDDASTNNVTITKGSGHTILTNDGPTYGGITVPTTDLTAITNTKLLAFTESAPEYITTGSTLFDGTGDYLATPNSNDLQLGTGDFTIEYWIYPTAFGRMLLSRRFSGATGDMTMNTNTDGTVRFYADSGYRIVTSALTLSNWYHIALVRHSGTTKVYVNGTAAAQTYSDSNNYSGDKFHIGAIEAANSAQFKGYMSNFRVVVGTAVYTSNFTAPTSGLTAITNTQLLTCQNSTGSITDASNNSLTITANGDATASAFGVVKPPTDTSTASNTLTAVGSTEFSYATPFEQGTGGSTLFYGTADSSNDYLTIASSSEFAFGTNDFTIEFFLRAGANTSNYTIIYSLSGSTGAKRFEVAFHNSKIQVYTDTGAWRDTGYTPTSGAWEHFAFQRDYSENTLKMFVGGIEKWSVSNNRDYDENQSIQIGSYASGSYGYLAGYLSNFRIVNGSTVYTPTAVSGGSTSFDGSGDYIDTTNPLSGTGDFTMEGWIYHTTSGTYDGYFSTCQASGANGGIVVAKDKFFVTHGGGSSQIGFSTIENNGWYHIALQRSSNVFSLYLNGVLQGTVSQSVSLTGSTLRLGSRYMDNTTYLLTGYISNFRIVTGTTVYASSGFTPPNSTLTAISNTQLLTCQNSTGSITDASSNGYTITANGNTAASTEKPFGDTITVPTSKLTAVTNTKLLTCNDSNIINDASSSNHSITISGNPIPTRFHPF